MKKRIMFKYCGGCNPFYDRTELKNRIVLDLEKLKPADMEIEYKNEFPSDILFVLNGCERACIDKFKFRRENAGKIIIVNDDSYIADENIFLASAD